MKKLALVAAICSAALGLACTATRPLAATSNPIGIKVGTAASYAFLGGLLFGGDGSIQTAAKQGGITRVATVDKQTFNVLYLVIKHTTIVTGE